MKLAGYFVLLIALLPVMCNTKNHASPEFMRFVKSIPEIPLPYSISCRSCCSVFRMTDSTLSKKYIPQDWEIIGKLQQKEEFVILLYAAGGDALSPVVVTFDLSGQRISTKSLFKGGCGEYMDLSIKSYFWISRELLFREVDTIVYYAFDTTRDIRGQVVKTELTDDKFKVNAEGLIVSH